MGFQAKINGLDKAKKEFQKLINAWTRQHIKSIVTPPAKQVRDKARKTAAFVDDYFRPPRLRKSIRIKVLKSKNLYFKLKIGPDPKKAPHGHLVEAGHAIVKKSAKKGILGGKSAKKRTIGHVPPHPFMAPTMKEMEGKIFHDIAVGVASRFK